MSLTHQISPRWSRLHNQLKLVKEYFEGTRTAQNLIVDPSSQNWATGIFLDRALRTILGDSAHIIHPDLSSIDNMFSKDLNVSDQGAFAFLEQIFDFKTDGFDRQSIIQANPDLVKPVAGILNTHGVKLKTEDASQEGGSHWLGFVILPKQFAGILNLNQTPSNLEKVYLFDSYGTKVAFPVSLKQALTVGKRKIIKSQGKVITLSLPNAIDPKADFITHSIRKQQVFTNDCGFWSLYNVIMTILEGSDSFWQTYETHKSPEKNKFAAGLYLRELFENSVGNNINDNLKCSTTTSTAKNTSKKNLLNKKKNSKQTSQSDNKKNRSKQNSQPQTPKPKIDKIKNTIVGQKSQTQTPCSSSTKKTKKVNQQNSSLRTPKTNPKKKSFT